MGDSDRRRGRRRPPGPPPGFGAVDNGTDLIAPKPELLAEVERREETETPADPGIAHFDEHVPPSSESGALEGRWRRPAHSVPTGGGGRSALQRFGKRPSDTAPRQIVSEETTDPGMASNLADIQLESAELEHESENDRFDRLLEEYARDFDDDATRVELEELTAKLARWPDLLATAKLLLARTSGTTGEDRVWAQLSVWTKRAHADDNPKTARSRLLDATFSMPEVHEPELEPPAPYAADAFPPYDYGASFGTEVMQPGFTAPNDFDFQPAPFQPVFQAPFESGFQPEPAFQPDLGPPLPFDPPLHQPTSRRITESRSPYAPDQATLQAHIVAAQQRAATLAQQQQQQQQVPSEEIIEIEDDALEALAPISSEYGSAEIVVDEDDRTVMEEGPRTGVDAPRTDDRPYDSARTAYGPPPSQALTSSRLDFGRDSSRDSRTQFTAYEPEPQQPETQLNETPLATEPPAPMETETELPLDAEDLMLIEPAPDTPPPPALTRRGSSPAASAPLLRPTTSSIAVRSSAQPPPPPPPPRIVDPALLKTGELDLALANAPNDSERARILVERAKRELHKGQRESAIDSYRDALAFETSNQDALEALERLYRDTKNVTRLVEILETKLELAKNDGARLEGLVAIAEVYENELQDLGGAVARLEAAHALQPKNAKPLQALARCHEKLGDFAAQLVDLQRLLRGENSRSDKLETLLRIASIQENELDHVEGAIDSYERILREHPQYKAALDDLARLGQHAGGWRAKAKIVEHRVELAKEPKLQAQLLVELGDLLAVAERDPESARKHYERAARVFPSYPASWRGLEQLSTWTGEPARAEFYLEQRVRHTQDLAERALVLIELAQYRAVVLSKKPESLAAYELAHKADPTNETAASALLAPFVAQRRWADAAVLCDVLYRVAVKSEDEARVQEILETSWKVASAMGNRAQMLAVAAARYRLAPDDSQLQTQLLDTAYELRDGEDALRRARSALDLLLARTSEDDPERLAKLAEVLRAAGDVKAAEECYERVLEKNPTDIQALAFLSLRAEARNDYRRAASLKERLARELPSGDPETDDRFQLLLSAGDLWLRAKGQVASALRAYEEALAEHPGDLELLRTLLGLYAEQETWDRVASTLRAIADSEGDPSRKAKTLLDLANVLETNLEDAPRAAEVLEDVLKADPKRLDAFERLVRIFTTQKDWIALANAYREMIGRLDENAEPKLAFALHHQVGLVYRDRIGDAERALKSFTQAATLRPDSLDERKIVTELLVVTQRLDAAVDVARATLRKEPLDPQL